MERITDSPFTYSRLSTGYVADILVRHYNLPQDCRVVFFAKGLHDNYLVEVGTSLFIFRVYRVAWRSPDEVQFELDWLDFLHQRSCPVAFPIRSKAHTLSVAIQCPEGLRDSALFVYAPGGAPGAKLTVSQAHAMGQALARIHKASMAFVRPNETRELSMQTLFHDSVRSAKPFLPETTLAYLKALGQRIETYFHSLADGEAPYSACIGDVNPTNVHFTDDSVLTLFDFDQCGYCWQVFDIAKFFASIFNSDILMPLATGFVQGYETVRRLKQEELDAIVALTQLADVWVMGIHAQNADYLGHKWLDENFWKTRMERLREKDGITIKHFLSDDFLYSTRGEVVMPQTLMENAIKPALKAIGLYSDAAAQLLLGTAIQESGLKHRRQLNDGPARGLFQMEPATHDDIWNNYLKYRESLAQKVLSLLSSPGADRIKELEINDKYAAAMARVHYYRVPEPLPQKDDIAGMAAYWKLHYNTLLGHGTEEQFVKNWEHVMGTTPA